MTKAILDRLALLAHKAQLVLKEVLAQRSILKLTKAIKAILDRLAHKVQLAHKVAKALLGLPFT